MATVKEIQLMLPHRGWIGGDTHKHDWHEFLLVRQGRYVATGPHGEIQLEAGQWVYWPPGCQHRPASPEGVRGDHQIYLLVWQGAGLDLAPGQTGNDRQRRLASTLQWMIDIHLREPRSQKQLNHLLAAIMLELELKENLQVLDSLERGRRFIADHADTDMTMKEAAIIAGMSLRHFQRCFRERYGRSPKQYFLELRDQRAMELLIDTDLDLDTIARQLDMPGASYLCRRIKQSTGRTPQAIRKSRDLR